MMKLYRLTIITLFVLIPVGGLETAGQEKHWLSYEPEVVELKGKLIVVRKYGPPNFGENPRTDAKTRVPILTLKEAVNLHGNPEYFPFNVEVRGIRRIQLLVFNLKHPYKQFIGRNVVVRGTLFHAHTGGHYTDVILDVHSINEVSERRRLSKELSGTSRRSPGFVRHLRIVL